MFASEGLSGVKLKFDISPRAHVVPNVAARGVRARPMIFHSGNGISRHKPSSDKAPID